MKTENVSNLLGDASAAAEVAGPMRVNVSQRRWVQRGASVADPKDYESRRKLIRTGASAGNVTIKSNLL